MIIFASMLVDAATDAGIKVPEDPENFDAVEYPHWHVFLVMQLGAPMPSAGCHWDNAKVVARIPQDKIEKVTPKDLFDAGFAVGMSK